jgi:hypothetical protein
MPCPAETKYMYHVGPEAAGSMWALGKIVHRVASITSSRLVLKLKPERFLQCHHLHRRHWHKLPHEERVHW